MTCYETQKLLCIGKKKTSERLKSASKWNKKKDQRSFQNNIKVNLRTLLSTHSKYVSDELQMFDQYTEIVRLYLQYKHVPVLGRHQPAATGTS